MLAGHVVGVSWGLVGSAWDPVPTARHFWVGVGVGVLGLGVEPQQTLYTPVLGFHRHQAQVTYDNLGLHHQVRGVIWATESA